MAGRALSWLALALLGAQACAAPPAASPATLTPADSSAIADVEPPGPAPSASSIAATPSGAPHVRPAGFLPNGTFASWTEKNAVDDLAHDCAYSVTVATDDDSPSPLACKLPYDQSCVYDPCVDKEEKCRGGCSATCDSCDKQCVTACGACESRCNDDACRLACGKATGACKQACLGALDRCATATCARATKPCEATEVRNWKAQGCVGKCTVWQGCVDKCSVGYEGCTGACGEKGHAACGEACEAQRGTCFGRCKSLMAPCDVGYCSSSMGPGQ